MTANIDYHVEGPDKKFYSVPYQLVRQRLDLRASATAIEVFKSGRRVAFHGREYGGRRYITDPAHMPASHRAHAEWTPSKLIEWGRSVFKRDGHLRRAALGVKTPPRAHVPGLPGPAAPGPPIREGAPLVGLRPGAVDRLDQLLVGQVHLGRGP